MSLTIFITLNIGPITGIASKALPANQTKALDRSLWNSPVRARFLIARPPYMPDSFNSGTDRRSNCFTGTKDLLPLIF